tara:strand:+ start:1177 stop:1665 length:489 start_codon:yes stop_codon:yes gene_type:complete
LIGTRAANDLDVDRAPGSKVVSDEIIRGNPAMTTAQYSLADLVDATGVPRCLIEYYRQRGLLETAPAVVSTPPGSMDLVDYETFACCAAKVGFADHDIARLLGLNEDHDDLALQLAMTRMAELTRQQQLITYVQEQLETWISACAEHRGPYPSRKPSPETQS